MITSSGSLRNIGLDDTSHSSLIPKRKSIKRTITPHFICTDFCKKSNSLFFLFILDQSKKTCLQIQCIQQNFLLKMCLQRMFPSLGFLFPLIAYFVRFTPRAIENEFPKERANVVTNTRDKILKSSIRINTKSCVFKGVG